jgi:prepilin-type N-terminal cleavage/methylation domain-containing protein
MMPSSRDTMKPRRRGRRAFTLVELVAVMLVLAVIAAVALPRYFHFEDDARLRSAQYAVSVFRTAVLTVKINDAVVNGGEGALPVNLDDVLQSSDGVELLNPFAIDGEDAFEIDDHHSRWHPRHKVVEVGNSGNGRPGIWYNSTTGALMFRVETQGSSAETIALYNAVNGADVTSLSQTSE